MADVGGVVDAVVPYLSTLAGTYGRTVVTRATQQGSDAAADATVGLGRRLLRRLLATGAPQREAIEAAVTDLGEYPDDKDFQSAVRAQLKKALAADPQLRSDLVELLDAAGVSVTASGDRSVAAHTISGIVATGDNPTIQR